MSRKTAETENDKRWLILRAKISAEYIKSAFRMFRANDIEPVLIKGWAAAREYPESHMRHYSDIDLCVAPSEFEKSLELIATPAGGKLNIDLHRGLRHLDTAPWEKLFENSETVLIDDVPVRILRAEDHLRILCVHWLTDGGADREKLLDIYYLLTNRAGVFDWGYCFESVDKNRRDWIIKTIALVRRFYLLDVSTLPFAAEPGEVPDWFMKALEREWSSETRLLDIHVVSENREELWRQIKRRLRPNPIQATVLMEGRFDRTPRFFYQLGSFFKRLKPSIGKTFLKLKHRLLKSRTNNE